MHRYAVLSLLVAGFVIGISAGAVPTPSGNPPVADRAVEHLMVWQVPAEVSLAGSAPFRIEVLRQGRPIHEETVTVLVPPHTEGGAVEVLATDPEKRALFAGLAERGDALLEVRITRVGEEIDRQPLSAVLGRGAALAERPVELLPLRYESADDEPAGTFAARVADILTETKGLSTIFAAGTDCSARDACRQECWDDYFACVDQYCPEASGSRILPEECSFCEDDRSQCQLGCPECECVDPKSVTYSTYREVVSATWSGSGCYGWDSTDGHYWDRYYVEYKYTRYKHTEACDGSVTTTVDSVWYESGYCWDEDWWSSCPNPIIGTPSPSC